MKILALADGSIEAFDALVAVDGIAPINVIVLPNNVPEALRDADLVVIALSNIPGNSPGKLMGWLLSQRIEAIPRVLCLNLEDMARHSATLKVNNCRLLSLPVQSQSLLHIIETVNPRFARSGTQPRRKAASASQKLDWIFNGMMWARDAKPHQIINAVSQATDEVIAAVDEDGLNGWLSSVLNYHSYTARHSMAVAGFAAHWSRALGVDERDHRVFIKGALLHDIGKMAVPLSILDKPGKLTAEEYAVIKSHPIESKRILGLSGSIDPRIVELAYQHHEMLDGSGYPEGLSGTEINDMVRCLTIIDIYSALIDARSYKSALEPRQAYAILQDMNGKLDMDLVGAFRSVVEAHSESLAALSAA